MRRDTDEIVSELSEQLAAGIRAILDKENRDRAALAEAHAEAARAKEETNKQIAFTNAQDNELRSAQQRAHAAEELLQDLWKLHFNTPKKADFNWLKPKDIRALKWSQRKARGIVRKFLEQLK